jgi:hypothetical protein
VTAQIKDAVAQEDARIAAETRAWQINAANLAGGICGGLALVCIAGAFLISAAAPKFGRGAALVGALCVGCFAFAQFLGSAWFLPVTLSAYGIASAVWIAWEVRGAIRKRESDNVAATNEIAVKPIVATLEAAYDGADTDHQAWLDAQIFSQLPKDDPAYRAAIHAIKASISLAKLGSS